MVLSIYQFSHVFDKNIITSNAVNNALQSRIKVTSNKRSSYRRYRRTSRRLEETPISMTKTTIFYFVGGTRMIDVAYSHGVRQTLWALYHNRPG